MSSSTATRLDHIPSADGTLIACERSGSGPTLIVVNGALSDRSAVTGLRPYLDEHVTVVGYDRRGRGDSGDSEPYAPEREMDDLAAVVSASGGPAFVFGHSGGAILALEAALRGLPVSKLALNEPPYILEGSRPRPSADLATRLGRLIGAGDPEAALHLFLTDATGLPEDAIGGLRASPAWPRMLALARTARYDAAVTGRCELPAAERLAAFATPTLILQGGATLPWIKRGTAALAESLPNARLGVLRGQQHNPAPDVLADALLGFFAS
jgi:pimeloyl-ACP methyl ester carboxylesterase